MRSLHAATRKALFAATKTKAGQKQTEHSKRGRKKSLAWLRKGWKNTKIMQFLLSWRKSKWISRKYIHGEDSKWLVEGQMCIQNMEEKNTKRWGKYHMLKIEKRFNTQSWWTFRINKKNNRKEAQIQQKKTFMHPRKISIHVPKILFTKIWKENNTWTDFLKIL